MNFGFMLASPGTTQSGRRPIPIESLRGKWTFDLKLDGCRAQFTDDHHLINRNGDDITHLFPEIAQLHLPRGAWLDGEIVTDGGFRTVAQRLKARGHIQILALAEAKPCQFMAFDLLQRGVGDGRVRDMTHEQYAVRRAYLNRMDVRTTPFSEDPAFYDQVIKLGLEGVVAKSNTSVYTAGRSRSWLKYKAKYHLTCLAVGINPGSGHREDFGALRLALLTTDGNERSVGTVGTGFDLTERNGLENLLTEGAVPVEIECVNVSRETGHLRFPVFVGLRPDLSAADCILDQLRHIPKY